MNISFPKQFAEHPVPGDLLVSRPRHLLFAGIVLFWMVALALGGAGAAYPLISAIVEVAAALLIIGICLASRSSAGQKISFATRVAAVIAVLILLLPLAQLIPLPPSVWQSFPGRERTAEIFAVMGWEKAWMPVSLEPEATKRAAVALLPGLAMFSATILLGVEERLKLVAILIVFAVFGAALGALQIATGGSFTLFESVHHRRALGLFTNRNHQAIFLLSAIVMLGALAGYGRDRRHRIDLRWLAVALAALLAAAVLATKSRSGAIFLMIAIPVLVAELGLLKLRWKMVVPAILFVGLLVFAISGSSAVQDLLARFQDANDNRMSFWTNTIVAIREYGYLGSGIGSFSTVYRTIEPLSDLTSNYVNHAHSDYLELMLTGGVPAMLLMAAALAWIAARAIALVRSEGAATERRLASAALVVLLLLILHSAVDYPLRMLSLEAMFGFLCALLIPAPVTRNGAAMPRTGASFRLRSARIGVVLIMLILLCQAVALALASHAVMSGSPRLSERLSRFSGSAASFAAASAMGDSAEKAEAFARVALRASPVDTGALSTMALVRERQSRSIETAEMMNLAAQAGWWDDATQIWMFDSARAVGRYDIAMERADALLRRNRLNEALFPLLIDMIGQPDARAALIGRLEENPSWRSAFLKQLDVATEAQAEAADRFWQMLVQSDAPPTDREVAFRVNALVDRHRYGMARQVWLASWAKSHRPSPHLLDGQFNELAPSLEQEFAVPFQWRFNDQAGVTASVDRPPQPLSGVALNLSVDPGFAGSAMEQLVTLSAGSYQLSYAMLASDQEESAALSWTLRCRDDGRILQPGIVNRRQRSDGWMNIAMRFSVPANCPAQTLTLGGNGQALNSADIWLDRVALSNF